MILPNGDQLLYHVTEKKNLDAIRNAGLEPRIGDRSRSSNETEPRVYLFRHKLDMEDAVMNWLGDEFDDDAELVALEVQMPAGFAKWLAFNIEFPCEVTYDKTIPWRWVKNVIDL